MYFILKVVWCVTATAEAWTWPISLVQKYLASRIII